MFTVLGQDEPFAMDDYFFAGRPPLVVDFLYHCGSVKQKICIVNMHLKCCGDGLYRRQQSMKQLHGFLSNKMNIGDKNIVVIGDWNDEIQDLESTSLLVLLLMTKRIFYLLPKK